MTRVAQVMTKSRDSAIKLKLPDGRTLAYAEFGDPAGKPLLYFHGGMSSRLDIEFASDYCMQNKIKLFAPDRPGSGQSSLMPRGKFSISSWVDDVQFLLSHLQIKEIPLLGWSLGAPYVFACAARLPEISRAATIGAAGPLNDPKVVSELGLVLDRMLLTYPENMLWIVSSALILSANLPPPLLKQVMISDLSAEADRDVIRRLPPDRATDFLYESMRQGPQGILDDYRATARPWEFAANSIKIDIQLWQGGDDKLCPMSMARNLEAMIPTSTLNIVPGQGHFLLHNKLEDVLSKLMN